MEMSEFLGMPIEQALSEVKENFDIVNYSKVEGSEFIEAPEGGFYLQATDKTSVVSEYRIYFKEHENFFPAVSELKGAYSKLVTLSDIESFLGAPIKNIRSINIPGGRPTMAGKVFVDGNVKVIAYTASGEDITCLHFKQVS